MWRIQYLQRQCCLCGINNKATAEHNNESLSRDKSSFRLTAALVCHACHNETVWRPSANFLYLKEPNRASPLGSSFAQNSTSHTSNHLSELSVQAAAIHSGYMRAALIAFKYQEQLSALPILVHALRQLPKPIGCDANNSVILPVPTTGNRLAKRGFNPTIILAHYLSRHWQIPLWLGVGRSDDAVNQQGLDRRERQQNMDNAFHLTSRLPTNKKLLLFDDVMTTGTTLSALALSLTKSSPSIVLSAYTLTSGK